MCHTSTAGLNCGNEFSISPSLQATAFVFLMPLKYDRTLVLYHYLNGSNLFESRGVIIEADGKLGLSKFQLSNGTRAEKELIYSKAASLVNGDFVVIQFTTDNITYGIVFNRNSILCLFFFWTFFLIFSLESEISSKKYDAAAILE